MESIIPQLIVNSIVIGSIYTLVTLGFNLIYNTTKFFNLTHGVISTIGAYGVFYLSKKLGIDTYLAITIAIIFAGFIGWLTEVLIYRRLRAREASPMILLVASLGLFTAIQAIIAILFSSQFQILGNHQETIKSFNVLGGVITETQVYLCLSAFVLLILLGLVMKFSKFGKAVKAISDDETVAKVVGIKTDKIIALVFFFGSMIAGVAGIGVGFDTGIEPTMGMELLLKGVVATIIGGVGSLYGGVVGAFLLSFIENFSIWYISGEWKDAIAFSLLILFLIFRPQGLFSKK